jgi:glycosyltransferase involved in cell wall biosynthesis
MRGPLRILVAHNVPFERPGGMTGIMRHIHDRIVRAGHHVEYFCAENVPAAARGRWGRFVFSLAVRRRVQAESRAGRPYDIVNVHEPSSALVAGARFGFETTAVVVTSHGIERRAWEFALEERRLGRKGPALRTRLTYPSTVLWQAEFGLRHADVVVTLNEEDRVFVQRRYRIVSGRIVRMWPGVDEGFATAAAGRDYRKADRILFAGTWRKNKGIEDIVPAFTRLAALRPSATLTVAGAGAPAGVVRQDFPEGVRSRVLCVDTPKEDATAALFAAHDIYVLPSLFEGTPLTLLEAMMSGLPIVTTATCGMKDVITHDVHGLLIPIRSPDAIVAAVARLLEHQADRERLGRAAQSLARSRYTWDRAAAPILRTYEEIRS